MSKKKKESKSLPDHYPIHQASETSLEEMSKWMALCNGLKFINNTSATTGIEIDEKDISHNELLTYINDVSGDIRTCIKEKGGVPFKYSLSNNSDESKNTEDLTYDFLS